MIKLKEGSRIKPKLRRDLIQLHSQFFCKQDTRIYIRDITSLSILQYLYIPSNHHDITCYHHRSTSPFPLMHTCIEEGRK